MALPVDISAVLKRIQSNEFDDSTLARKSNFLKWLKHQKGQFVGNTYNFSVNYAGLGGASHSFSVANNADVSGKYAEFVVPTTSDFKIGSLHGLTTRKALKGGINEQYVKYARNEMNLAHSTLEIRLARGAFRSGTGSRGVVKAGSNLASPTIQLENPKDARNFSAGDKVVASAVDGGALKNGGASTVALASADPATGNLTLVSGNWNTVLAALAVGDSLYVAGDAQNGAADPVSYLGWLAWNPSSAPTATPFANVNRALAPEILAGLRAPAPAHGIEGCLIEAMAFINEAMEWDANDTAVFISYPDFANLQLSKEGDRIGDFKSDQYNIGIEAYSIAGAAVIPDKFCPQGRFFACGKDAFELQTLDGVVLDVIDGNKMRHAADEDSYRFKYLVDGQFIAQRPNQMCNGIFPAS